MSLPSSVAPKESVKLSIEVMQEIAKSRGGECLSGEYHNWDSKLRWRCAHGHEWENRAGKIKGGQWCPTFAGKAPKGLDYLRALAAEKGGECLLTSYSGMQKLARWRCASGHEWEAKPNNIRYGGWCPYCIGRHQTIEEMRDLARSRGGECLSAEYRGQAKLLTWKCSDNHTWKAVPNSIKNGSWCPHCRINYGEEICRTYFEALFGKRFLKVKPKFLSTGPRGAMELDGYCEELQLAFEHHGEQHYRRIKRFQPTEQDFISQQQRDAEKLARCAAAGIRVVEIPAIPVMTAIEDLPELVRKQLTGFGVTPPLSPDVLKLDLSKIYNKSALVGLAQIAAERGGQLLSDTYLGDRGRLRWRCAAGHEWLANPNGIKSGQWCAACYGNTRKTIEEVRQLSAERGYKLLTEEYLGTNKKHRWQCQAGHEWLATPNKLLNDGTGCPRCAGQNRNIEDMREMARIKGALCLSETYVNATSSLLWRCANGHEVSMTPNYFTARGDDWCPVRRDSERRRMRVSTRMAALLDSVAKRGGRVVSGEYREPHSKFTFACAEGHQWVTTYDSVLRGTWCMECYRRKRLTKG